MAAGNRSPIELARAALLLAAHDPYGRRRPGEVLERASVRRHAFGWGTPTLCWKLSVVAAGPVALDDASHLTEDEAAKLLDVAAHAGQALVVEVGLLDLATTLAALAAEGGACARIAKLLGLTRADVCAALEEQGLDVEARTLGGVPWLQLSTEHASREVEVVASEGDSSDGRLPLRRALALKPDVRLGDRFALSVGCRELDAFLAAFSEPEPVGWLTPEQLFTFRSGGIEEEFLLEGDERDALVSLVAHIDDHRMQRLFDDGKTQATVFRCPASTLRSTIESLRARHAGGGSWWPVLIGSDADLTNTREARSHAAPRASADVLAAARPPAVSGRSAASLALDEVLEIDAEHVWVALVPVAHSFEVPAHFQCRHNATPKPEVLVELLWRLEHRFGAAVLEYRYDTIVLDVADPRSFAHDDLVAIARELSRVCPALLDQDFASADRLARALGASRRWTLWWD